MIAKFLIALSLMFVAGCMNLYVRCIDKDEKIHDIYQCTKHTAAFSYVVMFPQVMNPAGSHGFIAANILSIPVGCLCFVDVACEAVVDTVCLPYDVYAKDEK